MVSIRLLCVTIAATYAVLPMVAKATPCSSEVLKAFSEPAKSQGCECGRVLKNITATVPSSLTLVAACWLRSDNKPIDLTKTKVTFDSYTDGWIPDGALLLSGKLTLRGLLRVDDGPAGTYWFDPQPGLIAQKTPLSTQLGTLKFEDERGFQKLRIPKRLQKTNCLIADATLEVTNINLRIGDTDQDGARPVRYRVLKAGNFRRCGD